jgi:hypothetical protein
MKHIKIFEDLFSGWDDHKAGMGQRPGFSGATNAHKVEIIGDYDGITKDGNNLGDATFIVPNVIVKYYKNSLTDEELEEITEGSHDVINGDHDDYLQEMIWQCDQNGSALGNATDEDPIILATNLSPDEFKKLLESVEPSIYSPEVYNELDMDMIDGGAEGFHPNFVRTTSSGNCYRRNVTLVIV